MAKEFSSMSTTVRRLLKNLLAKPKNTMVCTTKRT